MEKFKLSSALAGFEALADMHNNQFDVFSTVPAARHDEIYAVLEVLKNDDFFENNIIDVILKQKDVTQRLLISTLLYLEKHFQPQNIEEYMLIFGHAERTCEHYVNKFKEMAIKMSMITSMGGTVTGVMKRIQEAAEAANEEGDDD